MTLVRTSGSVKQLIDLSPRLTERFKRRRGVGFLAIGTLVLVGWLLFQSDEPPEAGLALIVSFGSLTPVWILFTSRGQRLPVSWDAQHFSVGPLPLKAAVAIALAPLGMAAGGALMCVAAYAHPTYLATRYGAGAAVLGPVQLLFFGAIGLIVVARIIGRAGLYVDAEGIRGQSTGPVLPWNEIRAVQIAQQPNSKAYSLKAEGVRRSVYFLIPDPNSEAGAALDSMIRSHQVAGLAHVDQAEPGA